MNQILNGTEITRSTVQPSNVDRKARWFVSALNGGYDFMTGSRVKSGAMSYEEYETLDGRDNNYQESFNYEH